MPSYAPAPITYKDMNTTEGANALINSNLLFRTNIAVINIAAANQKIFSIAANRLVRLVTSVPIIGLNRKTYVVYGALYAIQR